MPARVVHAAPSLLLGASVAALVIRVAVRDSWRPLAPFFYATPLGVVVIVSFGATILAAIRRRRTLALAAAAVTAAAMTWVGVVEWRPVAAESPSAAGVATLRGAVWNAQGRRADWTWRAAAARALDPDLLVIVEGPAPGEMADRLLAAFPDHGVLALPSRRFVLVREGAATHVRQDGSAEQDRRVPVVDVRTPLTSLRLVIADLPSSALLDRGPALAEILRVAMSVGDDRVLVLGDFNTPRDSVHFDRWRGSLTNAFESAGEGWGPTWPSVFPVLSLDQVWAGPGIELSRCRAEWTFASDHRPVVFEFAVRDGR